jgi:hypothetical protein
MKMPGQFRACSKKCQADVGCCDGGRNRGDPAPPDGYGASGMATTVPWPCHVANNPPLGPC